MDYRTKQLSFRVTEAEDRVIRDRMVLSGINHPSAYLRKMEMDGYVINLDLSELKEILRLCGINSKNLNQVAKRANETGSIYEADIKDLQAGQEEMLKLLRVMMEKLSGLK